MQMSMWSCGITLFYTLFNMSSFSPLYFRLYMSMSASLYHYHLFLHLFGSHWECISLCVVFFSLFIWLLLLSQASEFPLAFPYILDSSFNSLLSFNLEKDTLFYIHYIISDKQRDHSQLRNLLHFKLLPCKRGWESPFYLLPWGSMRRIVWDGNSNVNGCHCWDFLFIRYLISITSLIPKIFYLEGLYCYIPPFCWRGDSDTTWSYGLPKIAEKNLYSKLCLCHVICIKFW